MKNNKLYVLLVLFLIPVCAILTQCVNSKKADPRGENYAGSASCIKCHQRIYQDYFNTPHSQSSRPAAIHSIHGSFAPGANTFSFNDQLKIVMEKRDSGLYQVAYNNGKQVAANRFDITFGSEKAETYLYWKNDQLFELPISYFGALHSWTNSPGYAIGKVNFERPIVTRCFECHSSYIREQPSPGIQNRDVRFDNGSIVYGIDCERCHGPSAQHVEFHTQHPDDKKAMYMASFKTMTRAQRLDACAVCHSGGKDNYLTSLFNFKMGDTLAKFKEPSFLHENVNPQTIDVHGNQNGLLKASKCFLMSNMDCNTCHDTHAPAKPNLVAYSQRCTSCHNNANHNTCKMTATVGLTINSNCIDCHMPAKPTNVIKVESAGGKMVIPYMVRTHYIAIYPEESKKILAFIKGK